MRYVALDCETGGIESRDGPVSLLTCYLAILDEDFSILNSLDLMLRPDVGPYQVTGEALRVNRIQLEQHDEKAIPYKQAGQALYHLLHDHSLDGKDKLLPLGHNVKGDIDMVCKYLVSGGTWNKFCSYRVRDTGGLAGSLMDAGLMPTSVKGSLTSLAEYFGVEIKESEQLRPHTAKGDVMMTIEIYKKQLELMKT